MTTPDVDEETVQHIAELAHISVAEEEVDRYVDQFEEILNWFAALDEVPTALTQGTHSNVLREDTINDGLDRDQALANASRTEEGHFRGPPVG